MDPTPTPPPPETRTVGQAARTAMNETKPLPANQGERPAVSGVETLPVRMLNEFVYCPRLFYYEHVEGVFQHNADTRRGAALHARVDSGKGELPPPKRDTPSTDSAGDSEIHDPQSEIRNEIIHSRSVSLSSDRLGVTAKLDLVEMRPAATAPAPGNACDDPLSPLTVCPVDYKIGAPREGDHGPEIWDADRMQLGLQCLILRDNGYACTEGIIYYRATKQRVPLLITSELERWIDAQIVAARRTMAGPIPPPLVDSPKCARCSLVTICLPD